MIQGLRPESRKVRRIHRRAGCVGLVSTFLALLWAANVIAQVPAPAPTEPQVSWIFPLGGRQGTELQAEVEGQLLEQAQGIWLPAQGFEGRVVQIRELPVEEKKPESAETDVQKKLPTQRVSLNLKIAPEVRPGMHSLRLVSRSGVSNPLTFLVSLDPVIDESESPHQAPSQAQPVKYPVIINGRISQTGEVDYYAVVVSAQEELSFQLFTQSESFRPVIRLYEEKGSWFEQDRPTPLEFSYEDAYRSSRAKRWRHRFPRAGRYLIAVGSVYGKAEPGFIYQLRMTSSGPALAGGEWPGSERQGLWSERQYVRELTPLRMQQLWSRTVRIIQHGPPTKDISKSADPPPGGASGKEQSDTGSGTSNTILAVFAEKEPNGQHERALKVSLPALVNGTIESPGDVDLYQFQLPASQSLVFELETPYVSPPTFSPSLKVLDSEGHELFSNKHRKIALTRQDPIFLVELLKLHLPDRGSCGVGALAFFESVEAKMVADFAVAGQYYLQIGDVTSQQGHPDYAYRVVVRPRIPHVGELGLEGDRINLRQGAVKKLRIITGLEEGYAGDVAVSLEGLPPGVVVLTGMEAEPKSPIGPTTERQESFLASTEKAVILLRAARDAPLTETPVLVRVWARPAVKNELGDKLAVGKIPLMVVGSRDQSPES